MDRGQIRLRGAVDVVLMWKLDRFGRSAFDLLGNIRQLEAASVRFVAITQGIDIRPGGDPMSRLLITLLSAIAEFERVGVAREGRHLHAPRSSTRERTGLLVFSSTAILLQLRFTTSARVPDHADRDSAARVVGWRRRSRAGRAGRAACTP